MKRMKRMKWMAWVGAVAVAVPLSVPLLVRAGGPLSVAVVNNTVAVSGGTASFTAASASVTWNLTTRGYTFTSQSIDFGADAGSFSCSAAKDGSSVTCRMTSSRSARGNYTVSVTAGGGQQPDDSNPAVWTSSD